MKIAFNPSMVAALTTPPNNKDITFDLRGRNIFARGVKFYGTDTNTWRDIKINNVSIGSHTLDLQNGSNTTLTNTNGVVTINSTWRPVVDNLTSDSTTSSLSAKQGKVLKALIDGKSNSDHNHDGRYVRYYAVTTLDCNNLAAGLTAARISATNAAHTNHSAYLYISDVETPFQIQIPDSSIPYIYKRYYGSGKWSGWFKLNAGYADSAGSVAWANVTGKPSSYTPSAHTHAWNSLTHSSTTENQAILTNGKANGWKLQTLNIARWDNAANNAHSHANKSVLDGITSALVNSWNTAYNFVSNITGTDTDKVINKWEEIVNFLAGITEDNKLNTLLNSKLSVYELANDTNVGTIKNNGIYYSTTDASSGTLINSPFNTGFAFINMTSYDDEDGDLRRSRLAFNAFGEIKVSDDRDQANTAETWYNVLTSKNSGINGSTIKLNGTSITVYSSGTADGRYVKKSGDTMSGVLTIDTPNFGALTIKRNDDTNDASIQFRGKSSVYGYIGLNNSTKDKQFLRWSSDTSRIYTILDTSSTYISNGKGVINGTTITQVDNATNSTNSTNARKLVNWYSARPTSLNAQFGDGSLRIFYATSSTTEGKPAEDSHILHLAWDNTDGWDAQLAVHRRSGKVSTRAQNDGTWQPWKTLAFTTDIPSSLKNPYSFNVFGVVYDGSAAKTVTTSTFISQVIEGESTVTDGTMLITSCASNSGFADINDVNVPYKRKAIHLWEYIKTKTDSRYYTESEVNSLLDAKLNRQNLSYGTWNPRGYHLAADYNYNGGDLSISESEGKIHVSVDGYFWQNEGQYRVLDTSDVAGLKNNLTIHQYLSAGDIAWYPLVWGGNSHYNTSDSTGAVYKSYDKLSWQTSSQTLQATNIQTNNIKNLSIEGGIYWNPNVETASDDSDAASITLVRSGVAGGTTLVLSQMNDTNDTIQFKTNTAARLYHNSYPILTTQNTYVSNNKGYINGTEITQVNNSDKVDNRHAISTTPNTGIIYKAAIYTCYSLTSYWVRLASIPSISQHGEFVATIHVQSGHSDPGRSAILLVYLRGNASSFTAKSFKICCNSNYDPNRFRLYYKDSDKTSEIWYQTTGWWDGIITTVISQSSEGSLYEGLTLYSGDITAVQTPSMSTYLSAQVSTITDNISGNASTATKLQTPRTIWGQSFDGTGNVSGSLSEVGNIHFKADNSYDIGSGGAAIRYIYTHWLGARSGRNLELGANDSGFGKGICINTNLNVGIGTNIPVYKLDVEGDIYSSGYVRASSGFIKDSSSDSYVLLGGGGHKLESSLKVAYSSLTGITLTGGDSNNGGYRLIFEKTMGKWDINYGVWAIAFRHSGVGTLNIGFHTTNYDGSTYTYNIRFLGATAARESKPFRAFYNSTTKVLRIYWHYYDYTSGDIAVLRGNMIPHNGTWMTSLPNDVGTELAITCNMADQATNADTVDGYHATDGRTFTGDIHWGSWHDTWSDGTHTHPWYGFDHRYPNTGVYSTTITDYHGMTIKTYNTLLLDCGTLLLNSRDNVGIGTTSPTQKLDVHGNIRVTGQIIREGSGQLWSTGRDGALLREISAFGYHTLWSLKTTDGSWDFGEYNAGSDWNNIPVLSYITDSNHDSGNNTPTYQIKFPLASGTVALTSTIPNPTNYYWANVKISTSSSTTTSPTVHTLTATRVCAGHNPGIDNSISCSNWFRSSGNTGWYNTTYQGGWYMSDSSWIRAHNDVGIYTGGQINSSSSIRMSNILLEHTDEINNIANSGIHLNYRNSGNVSLCCGGGNVGIGTTTPSYKLDVNGQMSANGFHHSSADSNNYILLAGGGYKSFGGDPSTPIFLGYLKLYHGDDGTISSSFYCLGYSVPFTYTRGGNYCVISIPDTIHLTFYIQAAIASVNYSVGGMDSWVGYHRGVGAWWLHCYVSSYNEVRVKGFRLSNEHNDSWWGGNPLYADSRGVNIITVCIFGYVRCH